MKNAPDIATRFTVGNQAWKARRTHGRKPKFENPEVLWEVCCQYFEWVNDNSLQAVELVKYKGMVKQYQVPRMRAMTIVGLCNYLHISSSTWSDYKRKPGFLAITTRVESIIFQFKYEGVVANLLNANIIAREMGLGGKKSA